jgi:hypothetical protein
MKENKFSYTTLLQIGESLHTYNKIDELKQYISKLTNNNDKLSVQLKIEHIKVTHLNQ